MGIFLISCISALSGGECESFSFSNSKPVQFEIIQNQSSMDGFSWNQNGSNVTYCFDIGFAPQNLTLKFFNSEEEEIVNEYQYGGGSGSSSYKPKDKTQPVVNNTEEKEESESKVIHGKAIANDDSEGINERKWIAVGILVVVAVLIAWGIVIFRASKSDTSN